jgi:hypothetical protein
MGIVVRVDQGNGVHPKARIPAEKIMYEFLCRLMKNGHTSFGRFTAGLDIGAKEP